MLATAVVVSQGSPVPVTDPASDELRPLLPQSGSVLPTGQVAFVWHGAQSRVELSPNRTFVGPLVVLEGSGQSSDPARMTALSSELGDGVWFWHVSEGSGRRSVIWNFRVRQLKGVHALGSQLDGADVNCDGKSDILLDGAVVLSGESPVTVRCSLGAFAVGDLAPELQPPEPQWGQLVGIGDVDGDGCADAALLASRTALDPADRIPVRLWFRGSPGLFGTWLPAGRVGHGLAPLGDVNGDGYSDTAECRDSACRVYLGKREGPGTDPAVTLTDVDSLYAGGDFDADSVPDFWAITHAKSNEDGSRLAFFSGKSALPFGPPRSFAVAAQITDTPGVGLIAGGTPAILGFARKDKRDWFWHVASSAARATVLDWSKITRAIPGGAHAQVEAWEYVPFVGPERRGILLLLTSKPTAGYVPKHRFLQFGFGMDGAPAFLGEVAANEVSGLSTLAGFSRLGDVDGDGYDDVLVHSMEDDGTPRTFVYTGSAAGFKLKREVEQSNVSFQGPIGPP